MKITIYPNGKKKEFSDIQERTLRLIQKIAEEEKWVYVIE